jgi:hypothetical protein
MLNLFRVLGIIFVLIGLSLAIASFGISVGQLAVVSVKTGGLAVRFGGISMPTPIAFGSGLAMMLFGAVALYYSRNPSHRLLQ